MKKLDFLLGCQIDSIRVYSVFLQISLLNPNADMAEFWLNTTTDVFIDMAEDQNSSEDFFDLRLDTISKIYRLIGECVIGAEINLNGDLVIDLEGHSILLVKAGVGDDCWSITNGADINKSLLLAP